MSKVFVVTASGGRYDDERWSEVVGVAESTEGAQTLADQYLQAFAAKKAQYDAYWEFYSNWQERNPPPKLAHPALERRPSFAGLKQSEITDAMRQARRELEQRNTQLMTDAYAPMLTYCEMQEAAARDYLTSVGLSGAPGTRYGTNADCTVEEVPFLKG